MGNLSILIKNYFSFSKEELSYMLVLSFFAAFMFSFRSWGDTTFNAGEGVFNLFNAFLIASSAVLVHVSAQKIHGLYMGYVVEHKPWPTGIALGVLIAFVTRGYGFFFGCGTLMYNIGAERLGKFGHWLRVKDIGFLAVSGPIANILLAIVFKIIFILGESPLAEQAMMFNLLFAIFNILPLPWVSGGNLFYSGRIRYVFFASFILAISITLYYSTSILLPIIFSLVAATALAFFWAFSFEEIAG